MYACLSVANKLQLNRNLVLRHHHVDELLELVAAQPTVGQSRGHAPTSISVTATLLQASRQPHVNSNVHHEPTSHGCSAKQSLQVALLLQPHTCCRSACCGSRYMALAAAACL